MLALSESTPCRGHKNDRGTRHKSGEVVDEALVRSLGTGLVAME